MAFTDWQCTKCGNIYKKAGTAKPGGFTPNKCGKDKKEHIWVLIKQK